MKILSFLFNGLFTEISGGARLYNTYLSDPDKNVYQGGKKNEEKNALYENDTEDCFPSGWMLAKLPGAL